jgi:hypothetical protein
LAADHILVALRADAILPGSSVPVRNAKKALHIV